MTKLLATTAIALIGLSGMASAQSVLERVLGKIDNSSNLASVNGTFANIAENIGGAASVTTYSTSLTDAQAAALGLDAGATGPDTYTLSQSQLDSLVTKEKYIVVPAEAAINIATGAVISKQAYLDLSAADKAAYRQNTSTTTSAYFAPSNIAGQTPLTSLADVKAAGDFTPTTVTTGLGVAGVNGSITNVVQGIEQATQTALAGAGVSAIEWDMPTLSWGDMATTALGAVNTGEITLGVNQAVDSAKTTSTAAYSAVVDQLGGSSDTGVLVLNVASNMTGINGSISNTMNQVNGTVGDLSTTALGAVNTGTITSGVNAAVTGIIGTSGTGQN